MIERIEDVPDRVVGLRASGEVTAEDYRNVVEPALRAAAESGEIRLLYELDAGMRWEAGAMLQDTKLGVGLGIGHHSAWRRTAIVTDVEWVTSAMGMLGWMVPGELRVFGLGELDAAREWVAAADSPPGAPGS